METLVLVAGLFLLFWFKEAIKGTARTAETLINTTNNTVTDSLKTYSNEVSILNTERRGEQAKKIGSLDAVYTNDDIDDLLAGLKDKKAPKKAPVKV